MAIARVLKRNLSQILLIYGVFAVVGVIFVVQINALMQGQLKSGANEILRTSEANIRATLKEPEAALASAAFALRAIVAEGDTTKADIHEFLTDFTDWMIVAAGSGAGITGVYGVFLGAYVDGLGWEPPEGYLPQSRPWYTAAREGRGAIVATDPYIDSQTNEFVVSYATEMFEGDRLYGDGKSIGVVALDIVLTRMAAQVRDTKLADGGFGVLMDANGVVISHMRADFIGREYTSIYPQFDPVKQRLDDGTDVAFASYSAVDGAKVTCAFTKLANGWYLGIVTPVGAYFGGMYKTIATLLLIFALMAGALCFFAVWLRDKQSASEKAKNVAVLANESKSKFLATMSHEIRTPMNAIIGVAQMQLQSQDLSDDHLDAWETVYTSGYGLLGIINDILDLSKIETGKLELAPVDYDVASMLNDAVQLNVTRIGGKPIKFNLSVSERLPARLMGDELRIKQILNNVLSNAFKYTEKGSVTLTVSHEHHAGGQVTLILKVADTGQGMKPDQLQSLFDEYTRFNAEANRNTEGTGLGMNITRRLVDMMNGKIHVDSEYGKGTVFTVRLTQEWVNNEVIGAPLAEKLRTFTFSRSDGSARLHMAYEPMPYGRVLVVDDVETNLFVAERMMSPYGMRLKTVPSGFAAIELVAAKRSYDIIFLDHMMPEMDGVETCAKLRGMGYMGTIVALTANAIVGNDKLFKENGFDDFLSKPIDARQLDAILRRYVRDAHKEEAAQLKADPPPPPPPPPAYNAELMAAFARDARKAVTALRETADSGDVKLFTTTAHAMKSALANIGEPEKSALAKDLEAAGKHNDLPFIVANVQPLIDALTALLPAEETDAAADVEEDTAFLTEQLAIVSAACAGYDDDTALAALDALLAKPWNQPTKTTIADIRAALFSESDFEGAGAMAETLSQTYQ